MTHIKVYAAIGVASGFVSMAGAVQTVVTGESLVPIGVVVALAVAAIGATVKVVRFIDSVRARLDALEKHVNGGE